jgi:DNA-binding CsgD family transcriptional regulator
MGISSNLPALSDAEQILRVLHSHLKKKREGIAKVIGEIAALQAAGRISSEVGEALREQLQTLVRREDELTEAEREILYRDARLEQCLRHHFPAMPDNLLVVSICIIDGLSTAQIAKIVFKSSKAVDHYRQEIRQMMNLQGDRTSLRRHLVGLVQNCTECAQ